MKRILALVPLAACSVGAGSAYVGQWKPHKQVDFEACLLDDNSQPTAPRCQDTKQVTTDVPGRKFWGVIVPFPSLGASRVSFQDHTATTVRAEPSVEVLRGAGRFAVGVRSSVLIDGSVGDKRDFMQSHTGIAVATTLIGHVSILDDLGLYGGVGHLGGGANGELTLLGGRALAGMQLALSRTHSENFIILSLEVDRDYLELTDRYRATAVTGHIGLFF